MSSQAPPPPAPPVERRPEVVAVHRSATHSFSKATVETIELVEGLGVRGDAHSGVTVKHRSRAMRNPAQPNLRQVHLIHTELFALLGEAGFDLAPGQLGENVTTRDLDLLALPVGTRLRLGPDAVITVTGLRNPCVQIERFRPGLLQQVLRTRDDGRVERLAGVMAVVSREGAVRPGDEIVVDLPPEPHHWLTQV